ncbi:putative cytochrome c, class III family protein [Desulfonema limicola]|uniref:Cytochrome c, class III family protein n=1 Tax=Desulfonema limicola TaxID=45656 RepID=A0A975B567_9BACT|nr:cytochrome c3 family protein [Desulfonema limicola]QTA78995.1 putative cytochrome c, class III family protein [Desulfonema limicola]
MDRKTLALLLTEALLIVVLVVVIAMDFNKPVETQTALHAPIADEHTADAEEAVEEPAEEAAEEAVEEPAEEAVPAEKKVEKAEPAKEKKQAEKPAASPAAGGSTEVADIVAMNNPAYDEHTKGIVEFTHKKHIEEYKIGCGDCHHDDKGQALASLKMGDPVQNCIACHDKAGKPEKGAKLSDQEKREYHMNALHDNCVGCHKDYNKEKNTKAAPATCGKCHPKK